MIPITEFMGSLGLNVVENKSLDVESTKPHQYLKTTERSSVQGSPDFNRLGYL